jgi:hypothetical protein
MFYTYTLYISRTLLIFCAVDWRYFYIIGLYIYCLVAKYGRGYVVNKYLHIYYNLKTLSEDLRVFGSDYLAAAEKSEFYANIYSMLKNYEKEILPVLGASYYFNNDKVFYYTYTFSFTCGL